MLLRHRRAAGSLIVLLLATAGCSATTADFGSGSDNTADIAAAPPAVVESDTESLEPTSSADATTTDATATTGASTTTSTSSTTTVEPIPLPERELHEVAPVSPPIEPVGTSNGDATKRAQWRLVELGFWLNDDEGRYGTTTRQAVMAFQKFYGLEADGVLGPVTAEALTGVEALPQGQTTTGTLVEIDKAKQLVFIVADGVTEWILNASTGTEVPYDEVNQNTGAPESGDSVTPVGMWNVYRQREEGWWDGDLGQIYRPKYFEGGNALHGSNHVPSYPASHGCVRISVEAMDWIWDDDVIPQGTTVWVHGEIPGAPL